MNPPAGVVDGLLAGRYRLTSRLAAGGVGEVWRAQDLMLGREVAVKTLRPELADDEDVRARFRAEARHTSRLSHPGIAAVYDFGDADGRAWLVLELVDGEPLRSVLRRQGRLDAQRTLDVVAQTAAALHAAHAAGVVHRDVKPANLLVRPDGRVKVTDFGIASAAGTAPLTRTGQVVGTAAYLAPEQADGRGASAVSDLYSLGVVAYECLSGQVPFAFDNPVAVVLGHLQSTPPPLPEDVPAPVRELVMALLAKDPADRPQSAQEVAGRAEALRRSLPSGGSVAVPGAPPAPATMVMPVVAPAPARPAPPRPVRPARSDTAVGLSGRPGQRRAVRATAVLLGLLALGLGLRESRTAGSASQPEPRPAASTPASTPAGPPTPGPSTPASQGTAPAVEAPVVVPPAAPAQEAPAPIPVDEPAQQEPGPADGGQHDAGSGEEAGGEGEEKDAGKADKEDKDQGKGKGKDAKGSDDGKGNGP